MSKLFKKSLTAVCIFSALFSFSSAHAAPDELDKFIVETSLFSHTRFGDNAEETKKLVDKRALTSRIRFTYGSLTTGTQDPAGKLVKTAMSFIGVPYKFGGNSETGLDCSALVQLVYQKAANFSLPRVAAEQARSTKKIARNELKPGDLVFFNTRRFANSHVGIFIGDNQFVHAPRTGAKVRIETMSAYWDKRFNGAHRVPIPAGTVIQAKVSEDLPG